MVFFFNAKSDLNGSSKGLDHHFSTFYTRAKDLNGQNGLLKLSSNTSSSIRVDFKPFPIAKLTKKDSL